MRKKVGICAVLLAVFIVAMSVAMVVRADDIVVVIHTPTNTTYGTTSIYINVSAAAYGAIDKVIAEIDGAQNVTLDRYLATNYYTKIHTFSNGHHVMRIFANDTMGASSSSQAVYFTVDTAPPTVTINSPANTTYGYHGIIINATVTDLSPISKVVAQIDGAVNVTLTLSGGYYVNSATPFPWGGHVVQIFANDSLGRMNSAQAVWLNVTPSLEDFPYPFVNTGGDLNMTFVVPSSTPHAPCGGAHTIDVMSAVSMAVTLGRSSDASVYSQYVTMDDYISGYDGSAVSFTALTDRNLIVMAGPGVNQEAYYYNSYKEDGGYAPYGFALPVTLLNNGTDYLQVWPSGKTYMIEYYNTKISADYGVVQLYYDSVNQRYVLLISGLGGDGTKAAAMVVSDYKNYALSGKAVIIKYYDSDLDGFLDTMTIVETVPFGSDSAPPAFRSYFPVPSKAPAVPSGAGLSYYPYPYINTLAAINSTFVVPSSTPHAPCGGAHTIDVMSAVGIAVTLGQSSNSSVYEQYVTMDDYISSYDGSAVSFTALTDRNLVVMAGPGVSQEAYYYNSYKVDGGYAPYGFALPVTLLNNGTDYLQVWPSGNTYMIEYHNLKISADYGVLQSYYDGVHGRYVLLVGGLGGDGTKAASIVLSNFGSYALSGKAVIIKYYDSDLDGFLDTISIVETVP
jgi:hypothetical protein